MRAASVLAALVALAVAGCGGTSRTAATGAVGDGAAALVPPNALAFVSIDTRLDSKQWQVVSDLTQGFRGLRGFLRARNLDLETDVRPALGDELDLAVLGIDKGQPEAIALVKPKDDAKLRELAAKFDHGDEHYTVARIGDWSVIADSQKAFDAVRSANSGRSLADVADFQAAMTQLAGEALAKAYADGAGLRQLPGQLGTLVRVGGSPRFVAARVAGDAAAVRLDLLAGTSSPAQATYKPTLLRDVPSGAIAAVSFKDLSRLVARAAAEPKLRASIGKFEAAAGIHLADLRAITGQGVFYVLPGSLVPIFVLEVQPADPGAAAKALRGLAAKAGRSLPLHVERRGGKVLLTDAPAGFSPGSGSLVDDQPFKDALAAADAPAEVTWLVYADIPRLAPIVQTLTQLFGRAPSRADLLQRLDRLGTLVAFGARSGSTARLVLRLTIR